MMAQCKSADQLGDASKFGVAANGKQYFLSKDPAVLETYN